MIEIAVAAYIWILAGDLLLTARPWEPEDWLERAWVRLVWPSSVWWVLRRYLRDRRTDLYLRTKHY